MQLPHDPTAAPPQEELGAWHEKAAHGVSSNALADSERERLGHAFLVGSDLGAGKKIRSVLSMLTLFYLIQSTEPHLRTFYATSHPNEATKVTFDIDFNFNDDKHRAAWLAVSSSSAPPSPDSLLRLFLRDLADFLTRRGLALTFERIAVSSAHAADKISFHIVLLDYWVSGPDRAEFYGRSKNHRPTGLIMTDLSLGKWVPCLDVSLGTKFRHLRTLHSTKRNQQRWLEKVTHLDNISFFDEDDDFAAFLGHTWTYVPEDCNVQMEVPVAGHKRTHEDQLRPRTPNKKSTRTNSPRGMELFRLLGLAGTFENITELDTDRVAFPSTLAVFRAKKVEGVRCPFCTKTHHDNGHFFPVRIYEGELRVSAIHCFAGQTCPGAPHLPFDKELYAKAAAAFVAGAGSGPDEAQASGGSCSLVALVGDKHRDTRTKIRDAVCAKKVEPAPGKVWAVAGSTLAE